MKKPFVLIAAIVAAVGLGTAVAMAEDTTKVRTSVTLHSKSFSGTVKAKNGCQKGRTVTLAQGGNKLGSDKSDNRGKYIIDPVIGGGGGGLRAVASERKITKNNGEKIVCKRGRSNKVRWPR